MFSSRLESWQEKREKEKDREKGRGKEKDKDMRLHKQFGRVGRITLNPIGICMRIFFLAGPKEEKSPQLFLQAWQETQELRRSKTTKEPFQEVRV